MISISCDDVAEPPNLKRYWLKRTLSALTVCFFAFFSVFSVTPVSALSLTSLPQPGRLLSLSKPHSPTLLKGMQFSPNNPLEFSAIVQSGQDYFNESQFKDESLTLIKYFLAALTVPKEHMWVNLSPVEQDRIIPNDFAQTEMGRDVLALDYLLKQITASLTHPDRAIGNSFWKKVYARAFDQYGTTDIPIDLVNKVWIVPDQAAVYVNDNKVYVTEATLKVMTERDYAVAQHNKVSSKQYVVGSELPQLHAEQLPTTYDLLFTEIMREIIVPVLQEEINTGERFEQLRQIYHAVVLATWYKRNLREHLFLKAYADQSKVVGIDHDEEAMAQKVYDRYLEAYRVGVFDFIREESATSNQFPAFSNSLSEGRNLEADSSDDIVIRRYFSGGLEVVPDKIRRDFSMTAVRDVAAENGTFQVSFTLMPSSDGGNHGLTFSRQTLSAGTQEEFHVPFPNGYLAKTFDGEKGHYTIDDLQKAIASNVSKQVEMDFVEPELPLFSNEFMHTFLTIRISATNMHFEVEATGFDEKDDLVFLKSDLSTGEAMLLFMMLHAASYKQHNNSMRIPQNILRLSSILSPDKIVNMSTAPERGVWADVKQKQYDALLNQPFFFDRALGEDVRRTYGEVLEDLGMQNYVYHLWSTQNPQAILNELVGPEMPLVNRQELIEQNLLLRLVKEDGFLAGVGGVIGLADEGQAKRFINPVIMAWIKQKQQPFTLTFLPSVAEPRAETKKARLTGLGVAFIHIDPVREFLRELLQELGSEEKFLKALSGARAPYQVALRKGSHVEFKGAMPSAIMSLRAFIVANKDTYKSVSKFVTKYPDFLAIIDQSYEYDGALLNHVEKGLASQNLSQQEPLASGRGPHGGIDLNEDWLEYIDQQGDNAVTSEGFFDVNAILSPHAPGVQPHILRVIPIPNLSSYLTSHPDAAQYTQLSLIKQ